MPLSNLIFCIVMVGGGGVLVMISRSLSTKDNSARLEENWLGEMLNGPPGYYRAVAALLGYVIIVVGSISLLRILFAP